MSCGSSFPLTTQRLVSQGAPSLTVPYTDWLPAMGLDTIKAVLVLRAVLVSAGNFSAQLAMQTASVRTDTPDAWSAVAGLSLAAASGVNAELGSANISVAASTAGKAWVRFGVTFSSGAAGGAADVALAVAYAACGSTVGTWRGQLVSDSATDSFLAVSPMVPAILADKIKAAIIVASVTGTFVCRVVVRYAPTLTDAPGAWVNTTDTNAATERNTGEITLTNGSNMYVQIGLAYSATGGGHSTADVVVSSGIRRT